MASDTSPAAPTGSLAIGAVFTDYTDDWRTPSGGTNRWRIETEVTGWNGAGGAWVVERWKWDRSGATHHEQPLSLTYEETCRLAQLGSLRAHGALR